MHTCTLFSRVLQIPAEVKTKINSSTCICIRCKCTIPVFCKTTPVQKINASLQKHHHAKRFEIKCSLEVVVVEQIRHARQNKFQTISKNIILTVNVQKTHSPKMLFSTKTFSTVIETCPDMMASCSFPENTKNNDLYLVRGRDLVKTNLNTSVNSRVKCSMHSSPNIVTAHRVYPHTFIPSPASRYGRCLYYASPYEYTVP